MLNAIPLKCEVASTFHFSVIIDSYLFSQFLHAFCPERRTKSFIPSDTPFDILPVVFDTRSVVCTDEW